MKNIVKYQLGLFMFQQAKYFLKPPRNLKLHKILCDYVDYIIRQNGTLEIACVVKYPTTNEYGHHSMYFHPLCLRQQFHSHFQCRISKLSTFPSLIRRMLYIVVKSSSLRLSFAIFGSHTACEVIVKRQHALSQNLSVCYS